MKKMENKKTDDNADINQYLTSITKEIRDSIDTMIMDAYGKLPYHKKFKNLKDARKFLSENI